MDMQQTKNSLELMARERAHRHDLHQQKLAEINSRDDKSPTADDREVLRRLREEMNDYDTDMGELQRQFEADEKAAEVSRQIHRAVHGASGVDAEGDGVVYRDFHSYALDYFITRTNVSEVTKITRQWGYGEDDVAKARMRLDLARTPANTLSSNVAGLTPAQHIAEIFQVINNSRPIVSSARRADLERGTLTYPRVDTKPVVAVQAAEKTEAGNTGLAISMQTTTASPYLGGGDLSWQAINWSTPSALRLWFDFVTADYALKTEQDAAQVVQHSGYTYNISSTLAALTDFSDVLAAIAAGAGDVYANSGRIADTVYMAPNALYSLAAIASSENANFVSVGNLSLSGQGGTLMGLNVIVSRGMDTGVIVVGDSQGLLVAETPGAPVEMQVIEPAIGGVEVGLIGAFEAVVVDAGAFAMITTAS